MKKQLYLLLAILILPLLVAAQRIEEKTYALPKGKAVEMDLKFGRHIKVQTWNKQEVLIRTKIKTNLPDFDEIYKVNVRDNASLLSIKTDYEFKEKNRHWNSCTDCDEGEPDPKYCTCLRLEYEIMLPADAKLTLETISGNIELLGLTGEVKAKSISGFVDMTAKPSSKNDLSFKSVTGEIYSDFDIKLDKNSTAWSKNLHTSLNGGGPAVQLETISGDIFFRKM